MKKGIPAQKPKPHRLSHAAHSGEVLPRVVGRFSQFNDRFQVAEYVSFTGLIVGEEYIEKPKVTASFPIIGRQARRNFSDQKKGNRRNEGWKEPL